MSTQTNTYVILGILYPRYLLPEEVREAEDDLTDDAHRKPRPYDELTILSDGMSGQYTVIGHVLARSDCDQGLDKPITLPELTPQDEARLDEILKRFPPPAGKKVRRGWHVLTHYR